MCFSNKNRIIFSILLFSIFNNFTPLFGDPLSDFIIAFAKQMAAQIDSRSAALLSAETSSAVICKELSNLIKNFYGAYGRLPIEALKNVEAIYNQGVPQNEKKSFHELLLDQGEGGRFDRIFEDNLFRTFGVAATLVKRAIVDQKPIDLDFFSYFDENYLVLPLKELRFVTLLWSWPVYGEDPIWKQIDFRESVCCVFFAILPNVPSKWNLEKRSWLSTFGHALGWTGVAISTGMPALGVAAFLADELLT